MSELKHSYIAYKQECYGYPIEETMRFPDVESASKFFGVHTGSVYSATSDASLNVIQGVQKDKWVIFRGSEETEFKESILGVDLKSNQTFVAPDLIKEKE